MPGQYSIKHRDDRLLSLWSQLDVKHEGSIDIDALRRGFHRLDHPLKDADHLIQDLFTVVDTSKDGRIQYDEFAYFYEAADRELWRIFDSVDVDHNGKIDKNELVEALRRAGIPISPDKSQAFFCRMDKNKDGVISFEEWRDFLIFMPPNGMEPNLKMIYSYYLSTVNVNPEGDVVLSDEINLKGLGYFLAGGIAGAVSRTATAPFDRIKVYLIAQTKFEAGAALNATKELNPAKAVRVAAGPIRDTIRTLWNTGGFRAFFAGNGLNVVKVLPESAIKFGSFEAAKRFFARLEGSENVNDISPASRFIAGGFGGVVSQGTIYPIDTLKFRVQCESVQGGPRGNQLIAETAMKMWRGGGIVPFFRGLPLGLVGIFPYSAIDLGTFEYLKRLYKKTRAAKLKCDVDDVDVPNLIVLATGATSGTIGASAVYPINVLRTRLQAQGTSQHPQKYAGMVDVFQKTVKTEGIGGLYKGLLPNMMKVIPAVSISYLVYENSKQLLGLK